MGQNADHGEKKIGYKETHQSGSGGALKRAERQTFVSLK